MIKIRDYLAWERRVLTEQEEIIRERNRNMLRVLLLVVVLSFAGLTVIGLFEPNYQEFQVAYLGSMLYMGLCLFFLRRNPELPIMHMTYGIYSVMVLLCIYSSAFLSPQNLSTRVMLFMMVFPSLFLDGSPRMDGVSILLTLAYLGAVWFFKTGTVRLDEMVNVVSCSVLGMVVGHFLRRQALRSVQREGRQQMRKQRDAVLGIDNRRKMLSDVAHRGTPPQAVVVVDIQELHALCRSLGTSFAESELWLLGGGLQKEAALQGITLYGCNGQDLIGVAEPRSFIGMFQRMEPLCRALEQYVLYDAKGKVVPLHFGIGVAEWTGDLDETVRHADWAAQYAQRDGTGHIVLYEEECEAIERSI